jgi:hypothetical protein
VSIIYRRKKERAKRVTGQCTEKVREKQINNLRGERESGAVRNKENADVCKIRGV